MHVATRMFAVHWYRADDPMLLDEWSATRKQFQLDNGLLSEMSFFP